MVLLIGNQRKICRLVAQFGAHFPGNVRVDANKDRQFFYSVKDRISPFAVAVQDPLILVLSFSIKLLILSFIPEPWDLFVEPIR